MQTKPAIPSGKKPDNTAGASVYMQIKQDILSSAYAAGGQIRESEVADRFGTSRTPVREALIRLESEGLVAVLPRRGARVLPVRAPDMREIYDILIPLESLAAEQVAARKVGSAGLAGLQAAMQQMETAVEAKDVMSWAEGDDAFHRELMRLHGSERLITITDALYSQAHRTQMISLRMNRAMDISNLEHRRIFECLAKGDPTGARLAMGAHRQRGGDEILEIIESYKLPPL